MSLFSLFWIINDLIAFVKCFCSFWSEWRVISSGVCHRLFLFEGFILLSGAVVFVSLCAWLSAVEWAVAIIVFEVEDPMTVLKIMGLSSLR